MLHRMFESNLFLTHGTNGQYTRRYLQRPMLREPFFARSISPAFSECTAIKAVASVAKRVPPIFTRQSAPQAAAERYSMKVVYSTMSADHPTRSLYSPQ